jgi:DNA-binding response OmpR family regulator
MKILVVDDDEIILDLITAFLAAAGYTRISAVTSARAAMTAIAEEYEPFDCLMLDIIMPGIDGIELCRWVRNQTKYTKTPILMVTAKSDKLHIDRAFAAGATDYVTKPFEFNDLCSRVKMMETILKEEKERGQVTKEWTARKESVKNRHFEFSEPHRVSGLPGFLSYTAFENYLLQISRSKLFSTRIFGLKICNAGRIYASSGPVFFQALVTRVAEALSLSMKRSEFFIAYAGEGSFVCVTRTLREHDLRAIKSDVNRNLRSVMHFSLGDISFGITICNGEKFRVQLPTAIPNALDTVEKSIKSVQEKAFSLSEEINQRTKFEQAVAREFQGS